MKQCWYALLLRCCVAAKNTEPKRISTLRFSSACILRCRFSSVDSLGAPIARVQNTHHPYTNVFGVMRNKPNTLRRGCPQPKWRQAYSLTHPTLPRHTHSPESFVPKMNRVVGPVQVLPYLYLCNAEEAADKETLTELGACRRRNKIHTVGNEGDSLGTDGGSLCLSASSDIWQRAEGRA